MWGVGEVEYCYLIIVVSYCSNEEVYTVPPDTIPPDVAQVSGYYTSTMQDIVGRARVRYMQSLQLLRCTTHNEWAMSESQAIATTQELSWQAEADTRCVYWFSGRDDCKHGQLKALSDVMPQPYIQVAATLLLIPIAACLPQ